MAADGRFPDRSSLREVQFCLHIMLSHGGFSAYQMAFGSNPDGSYSWLDGDEDLQSAQDTLISVHLAQQWELRTMAQGATLKEIANSKFRRPLT